MQLLRILAVIGAIVLFLPRLSRRLRGQLLAMSHPGGALAAGRVTPAAARAARRSAAYRDAGPAIDASWVDEASIASAGYVLRDDAPTAPITREDS
jgi:hypothetical protein